MRIVGIAAAFAVLFAFLSVPALAERITLKGDVTYRERIALPEGGTLSVSLIDLATADKPRVTASAEFASKGKVPLTFTLGLDSAVLNPTSKYALVAEIVGADGAVWFRNVEAYAVDPVAPVEPILILVNFQGTIGTPEPAAPVAAPAPAPIIDVTWRAQTVAGKPVVRGATSSLLIDPNLRAGGRGGCNSWFAQAQITGQSIAFAAVAATRMACASDEVTAQEQAFFDALGQTRFWRLDGDLLSLLDTAGGELAVLERSRF